MSKPPADPILHRIRRIQGQASALESQRIRDADLSAFLQQIAALRGALAGLSAALVEEHLGASLADLHPELSGRGKVHQILQAMKAYMR